MEVLIVSLSTRCLRDVFEGAGRCRGSSVVMVTGGWHSRLRGRVWRVQSGWWAFGRTAAGGIQCHPRVGCVCAQADPKARRSNSVFLGCHVDSTARMVL